MNQTFTSEHLQLEAAEDDRIIKIRFLGKSILRDPSDFVMPVLIRKLDEAIAADKRLVLDFCELLYMNSSTLAPIIKILERARMGNGKITISYKKSLKWQDISFSALVIFQTTDYRIEVLGME